MIAGDWTGEIRVWNAADGTRLGVPQHEPANAGRTSCSSRALIAPAQQKVNETQTAHQAAATAVAAQQAKVDASAKTLADAQKAVSDQTAVVASYDQSLWLNSRRNVIDGNDCALEKAIPEIKAAAEKATAASATTPTDEELKKLAVALTAQVEARAASLQEMQKSLEATKATIVTLNTELATHKTTLQTAEQAMAAAKTLLMQKQQRLFRSSSRLLRPKQHWLLRECRVNSSQWVGSSLETLHRTS